MVNVSVPAAASATYFSVISFEKNLSNLVSPYYFPCVSSVMQMCYIVLMRSPMSPDVRIMAML